MHTPSSENNLRFKTISYWIQENSDWLKLYINLELIMMFLFKSANSQNIPWTRNDYIGLSKKANVWMTTSVVRTFRLPQNDQNLSWVPKPWLSLDMDWNFVFKPSDQDAIATGAQLPEGKDSRHRQNPPRDHCWSHPLRSRNCHVLTSQSFGRGRGTQKWRNENGTGVSSFFAISLDIIIRNISTSTGVLVPLAVSFIRMLNCSAHSHKVERCWRLECLKNGTGGSLLSHWKTREFHNGTCQLSTINLSLRTRTGCVCLNTRIPRCTDTAWNDANQVVEKFTYTILMWNV